MYVQHNQLQCDCVALAAFMLSANWVRECVCVSPRCCIKSVVIDTLPLRKLWRSQRQRQRQQQQQQRRQCGNNAARESAPLSFPPSPGEAEKERERERESERVPNTNANATATRTWHMSNTRTTQRALLSVRCVCERVGERVALLTFVFIQIQPSLSPLSSCPMPLCPPATPPV